MTKRSPTKISYAWVSAITQEPTESPIAFLERIQTATIAFYNREQEREVKSGKGKKERN